jgi:hypothetical protein
MENGENGQAVKAWRHDTLTVVGRLAARPEVLSRARVVGAWVWVAFDTIPDSATRDFLKSEGFRFNFKRKVWQHSGGRPSVQSAGDPRDRYGEQEAVDVVQAGGLSAGGRAFGRQGRASFSF